MSYFVTVGGEPCRYLECRERSLGRRVRKRVLVSYPDDQPGRPAKFPTITAAMRAVRKFCRRNPRATKTEFVIEPAWRRNEDALQAAFAESVRKMLSGFGIE